MKAFEKGTGYFKIPLLKPPHPKRSEWGEITSSGDSHLLHASRNSSRSWAILYLEWRLFWVQQQGHHPQQHLSCAGWAVSIPRLPAWAHLQWVHSEHLHCHHRCGAVPRAQQTSASWRHRAETVAEMRKAGWKSFFSRAVHSSPANLQAHPLFAWGAQSLFHELWSLSISMIYVGVTSDHCKQTRASHFQDYLGSPITWIFHAFTEGVPRHPRSEPWMCSPHFSLCGLGDNLETGGRVLARKSVVASLCQLSIPAASPCHLLLVPLCFVRQFIMGF